MSRSTARPIAMACTSLGLAGLLVATVLPSLLGGTPSLAPQRDLSGGAAAAPAASQNSEALPIAGAPGATADLAFGAAGPSSPPADDGPSKATESASTPPRVALGGGNVTPTDDGIRAPANKQAGETTSGPGVSPTTPLLIGSLLLLIVGVALLGLQFAARRVR
jgi:hypothetical protein